MCGFSNRIDVSVNGLKLGLSLGWKEEVTIKLRSYSNSHIDIEVMENNGEEYWHFTAFNGSPIEHKRKES